MLNNNFNFLRLVFALLVVVSHSYSLALGGTSPGDYLARLTNGQVSFSFIGLSGFFSISGYLVFQSLNRSKSLWDYFKKRILRIFPGLFTVLFLTLLLGYFVYDSDLKSYVSNASVWTYLPRNFFLLKSQFEIEGIFTKNPYPLAINGSLWSIFYEFSFYIALAVLFFFKKREQLILTASTLFLLLVCRLFWNEELSSHRFTLEPKLVLEFGPFFAFGSLLAIAQIENITIKVRRLILVALTLILVSCVVIQIFDEAKFFIIPIIVILSGIDSIPWINSAINKLGDISYGVYIYAFPVQQTIVFFFRPTVMELMLWSIIISLILGFLSWHGVEKRALLLKKQRH